MRILITGGLGFIGSHLADWLIEGGHDVWVVDNCETGKIENQNKKTKAVYLHTIIDLNRCIDFFDNADPDIIIHCAASYKDPNNWIEDSNTNLEGTINILNCCQRYSVKRLIYFQTSLCYGPPQENPITENHPIDPQNSYAITKTAAEQFIQLSGIDFVSFRLANVYGPRNLSGAIPTFYKRIKAGDECIIADTTRDFIYIDDLCKIVMLAVNGVGNGIYNVSSDMGQIPIAEIFLSLGRMMKCGNLNYIQIDVAPDDVGSISLDNTKLKRDFGIVPETKFGHGLQLALDWYEKHGVGETYTHLKMKG